jgi:DtxR family Mn-dependent transcriptional regulator
MTTKERQMGLPQHTARGRPLGEAAEDFVKAVYLLRQGDRAVATSALAGYLGLSDAAVTKMARRLDDYGLVAHTPYHGVTLTVAGERVALEVVRHHRLLELFLAELLGYDWAGVHAEADRLEHVVSPDFVERVDRVLGRPQLDPHGDPIPTPSGEVREAQLDRLSKLEAGQQVTIRRVLAQEAEVLRYLADLGLVPGAVVEVVEVAPFGGPVTVRVGEKARALDRDLAGGILVASGERSARG